MNSVRMAALAAALQGLGEDAQGIYEKTVHSVVAVRAMAPVLGERSGTGVVLTRDGLILTSYATCPEASTGIRVWMKGPRLCTAELVATSSKDEIAILRIKPKGELKPIAFGDSRLVRVGDVSYTLGNAANSIILDDQPSLNAGIISAFYRLAEPRANSTYAGRVLETTAAVNAGMEGAPLLDRRGLMIGFVTLNYSPHRFLGTAIPVDDLKPVIASLREGKGPEPQGASEAGEGYLGIRLEDRGGTIVVVEVDEEGPASRAGIRRGDVILGLGESRLRSAREIADRLKGLKAGSVVWLKVDLGGSAGDVKVVLEDKQ